MATRGHHFRLAKTELCYFTTRNYSTRLNKKLFVFLFRSKEHKHNAAKKKKKKLLAKYLMFDLVVCSCCSAPQASLQLSSTKWIEIINEGIGNTFLKSTGFFCRSIVSGFIEGSLARSYSNTFCNSLADFGTASLRTADVLYHSLSYCLCQLHSKKNIRNIEKSVCKTRTIL